MLKGIQSQQFKSMQKWIKEHPNYMNDDKLKHEYRKIRGLYRQAEKDELNQGKNNLQSPWLGLTGFMSISIMLTLLVFIGEAVRDAFDPRKVNL